MGIGKKAAHTMIRAVVTEDLEGVEDVGGGEEDGVVVAAAGATALEGGSFAHLD